MTTIPIDARRFGAAVTVTPVGSKHTPGTVPSEKPVTIKARTSKPSYQKYWGRCVHDMVGFIHPGKPVPLDSNHDTSMPVGVADEIQVVDGDLMAFGRLIPFTAGDEASKIIYQGSSGIPYQASIVMSLDGLEVEEVPEGKTVVVNGTNFAGPGTVFRRWGVDGIAVLPYGSDSNTSVEFGRHTPVKPTRPISSNRIPRERIRWIQDSADYVLSKSATEFTSSQAAMIRRSAQKLKGVQAARPKPEPEGVTYFRGATWQQHADAERQAVRSLFGAITGVDMPNDQKPLSMTEQVKNVWRNQNK